MRAFVVTKPDPIITYEEAVARCKLGGGEDERADVEGMIAAATGHLDGPDGWLGRALGLQTLEARFDLIGCGQEVRLPYPPVVSLVSVTYLDAQQVERAADLADFELLGRDLVPGGSEWVWLGGSMRREAARIQYRAGYGAVPEAIRTAILLMVGDLYQNRETTASGSVQGQSEIPMSPNVKALLRSFRVWG